MTHRSPVRHCVYGLLLTAALAAANPVPAYAQETHEFSVESTDPTRAIHDFGDQAELQIIASTEQLKGKRLHEVTGVHSTEEALNTLLNGTGLTHRYVGERTVALVKEDTARADDTHARSFWDRARLAQADTASSAQTQSPQSTSSEKLEEIVVTAQKRLERLIDVPISIVALNADELQKRKINRLDDLSAAVPGLAIESDGNGGSGRRIVVRGIGNIIGNSSLIGMYLDEAAVTSNPTFQLDLSPYDLERVEVLRGPQGTLYGEGSVGGTVRFITRDPVLDRFGMKADVAALFTPSGAPSQRIQAVVNVPLVENELGLRVAGTFDHEGGWIDQPAADRSNINDQNLKEVRVKGLWRPAPETTVSAMVLIHRNEIGSGNGGEDADGNLTQQFHLTTTPSGQDDYDIFNVTASYDFAAVRLLNTTSYIDTDRETIDSGGAFQLIGPGAPLYETYFPLQAYDSHNFSDELRMSSAGSGPWQWTAGAFYRHARFNTGSQTAFADFLGPPGTPLPVPYVFGSNSSLYKSWAVFGDTRYRLTDRFTLGAGLREFHDDQEYTSDSLQTAKFHSLSPRLYGQYKWTDRINTYASAAKGFRSGGFNSTGTPPFDPETVWTYELGTKMSLLEGRLTADAAIYYGDYQDYVVYGTSPSSPILGINQNAGKARIKGVEWALTWHPADQWGLSFNGDFVDTRFDEINLTPESSAYAVDDPIDLFPKHTFTASAEHEFKWNGKASFARLDYSQQGRETFRNRSFGPLYFRESEIINVLNLNLGLQWNDALSLGVFAQNLLNARRLTDPTSRIGDEQTGLRSRPRTYGIEFGVNFE